MINALFYAHSGLRYLVLLAGIAALVYYAYAWSTGRPVSRASSGIGAAYTGLLDLQILLGLILMVSGVYYGALIGHLVMMVLAAAAAHGAAVFARGQADPKRYHGVRLAGVVLSLVLIVGGISAIGRQVFGSGVPSITS